jgi:separase
MPALPFVLSRHVQPGGQNWLWHVDPGVHPNRTFYVLNPAGDLVATQETFEEAFSNRHEWEGFTGTAPSCDAYKTGLQTKDLFIYCGHSTGERYLRGSDLAKLGRCAVTMLMGCSSGKLRQAGTFGVEGMPLSYVLAGCPALVANLWDVTDKDIDKFSNTLLESWVDGKGSTKAGTIGETKDRSLPEELPQARKACKFLYLNGAAPVCYGVPCVPVAVTT